MQSSQSVLDSAPRGLMMRVLCVWMCVCGVIAGLFGCADKNQATAAQLDQLAKQCAAGDVVFVAGIGPVDALLLANLQNAGERMCGDVRTICEKSWSGKECGALKALYAPELLPKK
jgi:hypothetical protein